MAWNSSAAPERPKPLLWAPDPAQTSSDTTEYRQHWRRRTWVLHIAVIVSHLMAFAIFLAHSAFGYAPQQAVLLYGLWIACGMLFITWAYRSGWNETLRDPGMFLAHQLIAITGALGLLLAAPGVAFQVLLMLIAFSADGFLARRRTSFLMTWILTLVAMTIIIGLQGSQMQMTTDTTAGQLIAVAVIVAVVFRCSLLVTYFRSMQYSLSASHEKLSQALAKIELLVRHDELTTVLNRRGITERLQENMESSKRYTTPLTVALLDVDRFKQINDRYGHDAGDEVLRSFGKLLNEQLRASDCVGRYGGEEFLLVLPNTPLANIEVLLNRIRRFKVTVPVAKGSPLTLSVTCTVGATEYLLHESLESTIARADGAMYRGKKGGRDRVVLEGLSLVTSHAATPHKTPPEERTTSHAMRTADLFTDQSFSAGTPMAPARVAPAEQNTMPANKAVEQHTPAP